MVLSLIWSNQPGFFSLLIWQWLCKSVNKNLLGSKRWSRDSASWCWTKSRQDFSWRLSCLKYSLAMLKINVALPNGHTELLTFLPSSTVQDVRTKAQLGCAANSILAWGLCCDSGRWIGGSLGWCILWRWQFVSSRSAQGCAANSSHG